jgi:hypothetical protein
MSLIKANAVQVGQSPTATQNFTLAVPSSPDGTIKLARGNSGATTQDVLSVDASGNINGLVKTTGSTTARSLANRFADVVNVKDFGAVGDGVTDDTAAIQAAIDYSNSIGGCIVFLPEGIYKTSSPIQLKQKVLLNGSGTRSTTIVGNGTHSVISAVGSISNILSSGKLSNLTIRGSSKVNTNVKGIEFAWVNRYEICNVEIFQCYIGFYFSNAWQTKVDNIQIHGAGTDQSYIGFYGAEVDPSNQNNVVNAINCIVQGVEKYGFRLINFNGSKFTNCEALDGEIGFYLGAPIVGTEAIRWGQFSNCLADTNSVNNWRLERGGATSFTQCSFSNCWAGNSQYGFIIFDASQINISSPMIVGDAVGMIASIEMNRCARIVVSGGSMLEYATAGVQLNDCEYCNINTNHTYSSILPQTHKGFAESGTSNNNIGLGNTFYNGITVIGAQTTIVRNNGQGTICEKTGSVTLLSSATSVTVTHGLSYTPSIDDVRITPRNDITPAVRLWVTNMTSTQFTINSNVSPAGNCLISWSVNPIRT